MLWALFFEKQFNRSMKDYQNLFLFYNLFCVCHRKAHKKCRQSPIWYTLQMIKKIKFRFLINRCIIGSKKKKKFDIVSYILQCWKTTIPLTCSHNLCHWRRELEQQRCDQYFLSFPSFSWWRLAEGCMYGTW